MFLWSFSLFLSTSVSIVAIQRAWRSESHPIAFVVVYALFGVVFMIAEGDTSNGTDLSTMLFVYGSFGALPFVALALARFARRRFHAPGDVGHRD